LLFAGTWNASDLEPSETRVAVSEANESETDRRRAEGARVFEEAVRRAWVYPGTRRAIRRKYLMDWSGWDE
jgi:hypothetical protein